MEFTYFLKDTKKLHFGLEMEMFPLFLRTLLDSRVEDSVGTDTS